jgi:regulator of RNase E activity RraB
MKPYRLLCGAAFVVASFASFPVEAQTSIAEQQDERVIENLRQSGADIKKVHDIDFFLIFRSQADAMAISEKMRVLGYDIVGVKHVSTTKQWELQARRKMVPGLEAMQASTRSLQTLAADRRGYYDGWGTVGIK